MGIRKFISLLLLVAFTLQLAPANAASYDNAGATLPTVVQDSGTKATGANRDVVPVTLRVNNILSGELVFSRVTNVKNGATATVSMTSNGQLSIAGGGTSIVTRRAIVLTPPAGTQFVGLPTDGYATTLSRAFANGLDATARTVNVSLGSGTSDSVLPGGGSDTNGNLILAGVITENGPSAYFGSTVTKGSIVVYPVTFVTGGGSNTSDISFQLTGFGLVADPAGDTALSGTLSAANFSPTGGSLNAALTSISTSTVSLATAAAAPAAGKLEAASLANEPDNQANVVLASRLATGSSTVKIGPGLITSTGTGLTSLNVDTDAIIIRARERADSTTSTKTYHQTPFATSAFVPGQALTANGSSSIAILNTALTNATRYPNTSNALITVTFKAVNPADGTDSDATLVVDAVNVSLFGERAFNKIRDLSSNQTATLANGGWLGALAFGTNGNTAETRFGPGVIYNGTSSTAALVVKDATPADYSTQTAKVGFLPASNLVRPNATTPTSVTNGTTTMGIFPASLVVGDTNNGQSAAYNLVATANGSGSSPFSFSLNGGAAFVAGTYADAGVESIYTPTELTARLLNVSANAWFTILGTENNSDLGNGRDLTVGATNLSAVLPGKAPIINASLANRNAANNAIAVANLTDKVLTILPLTNRYDGLRDALAIRPEMTLTLGTNSRTQGVKVIAVISGGNIGTSEEVVVAEVLAAGSLSTNFTLQTLPIAGDMTSLMVENGTNAGNGRALIALSDITGVSTTTDALSDLVGTLSLDTTKPPLFCGGTAGSGKNGPNGVVFQPKGRTILITEAAADQFKAIDDLGTARIRVTLPTGWDLNAYNGSLADSQILGVIATGGNTFTSDPALARVQPRNVNTGSSSADAAFIDIDVGTPGTTTQTVSRIIGLVFKPNVLVAPAGTTNFDATVTVVDVGSTNTRGATIADDTILATLGTVSLADACSSFLTLSYCDDAVSTYQASGTFGTVASARLEQAAAIANGANLTEFSTAPTSAIRLIANTTSTVALPDLCIEEGIADALPIGQGVDGVPNAFGVASVTTNGTGILHIASSFEGSAGAGLEIGGTPFVLVSDNTVTVTADPTGASNEVVFTVAEGSATGRKRPFLSKTQFRVGGLRMEDVPSGTVPPAQSLIAWFEAVTGAGDYVVGTSHPLSVRKDTVNGNALVGITSASAEDVKMAANFLNGDVVDSSAAVTDIDFASTSTAANNDLSIVFGTATTSPVLSNAVTNQVDDSTYNVLNADTVISVSTSAITGSTDKLVEVSGAAGSLEPGSTLTISSSGTGPSDSVFVPVLPNGSFKGVIRAATSQTITLIQTPDSADTSVAPQIRTLAVEDLNVDPAITAAVAQDIGLGTVSSKGKVPVVFQVTSTGKSGGLDFVPTASQLTLGGAAVTAVAGSTNKFIGLVDFAKSNALTVVCTVGSKVSTVTLTELDSEAATKLGAPTLTGVRNNAGGFIVLKGQRLRNGQTFGFVLNDGTFQAVTLRNQTKNEVKTLNRRSAAAETIPASAVYAVFSVPDRGVASRAITTP